MPSTLIPVKCDFCEKQAEYVQDVTEAAASLGFKKNALFYCEEHRPTKDKLGGISG